MKKSPKVKKIELPAVDGFDVMAKLNELVKEVKSLNKSETRAV